MEYGGESLSTIKFNHNYEQANAIFAKVIKALNYLELFCIFHNDIKEQNIMIEETSGNL